MSFLFPLFLVGAAAIAIPLVLHLARRRTRKEVPFGSLMFLAPTAPRFEARKRLEHWLLLALRCLAVVLLAAAFARPFFTRPMPPAISSAGERVVLLVDTSASMRRPGLWGEALERARARLARARPGDRVAVLTFDRRPQTVIDFDAWAALGAAERAAAAGTRLAARAPGWGATDLGRALVAAAELVIDDEGTGGARDGSGGRVVLIGDLQEGSRLEALSASDWPARLSLELETVQAAGATNVALHALPERDTASAVAAPLRVRVASARGGAGERFRLHWEDGAGAPLEVRVAPGSSQVLQVPARTEGQGRGTLVVEGDDHDFDNRLHVAPAVPVPVRILYLGRDDAGDAQGALFYLRRAFPATRRLAPEIAAHKPGDREVAAAAEVAHLVVVTTPPGAAAQEPLRAHLQRGRTVLLVLDGPAGAAAVGQLAGAAGLAATEAGGASAGYALLSQVDLGHPLLAPFADPRFSDFTKIRFWKHRRLDERQLPGARVLARFDDGAPAWLTVAVGKGQLFVMAAGWHPADSQLALSSKMVPLLHAVLESSAGLDSGQGQFVVGDPIALPAGAAGGGGARRVRLPDGKVATLPPEASFFAETDAPGSYVLETAAGERAFAVNLDPAESEVAPLLPEALERLGLLAGKGGGAVTRSGAAATARAVQERAFQTRLEEQQRLWRWLLIALITALLVETWLGAFTARRRARA